MVQPEVDSCARKKAPPNEWKTKSMVRRPEARKLLDWTRFNGVKEMAQEKAKNGKTYYILRKVLPEALRRSLARNDVSVLS